MPISSAKIHSPATIALYRGDNPPTPSNALYYVMVENSKLGKQYELVQLNFSACLTVAFGPAAPVFDALFLFR
jgi:hypothetical protein